MQNPPPFLVPPAMIGHASVIFGTILLGGIFALPEHPGTGLCGEGPPATSLTLAQLWTEARELEPGYSAAGEELLAERAVGAAIRREWLPNLSVDGLGNWGHRLSPGEERVLGVGPRGELRLVGGWTLLDRGRGARAFEAERRIDEARLRGAAFDIAYRAEVARLYVEAALADELIRLREEHRAMLLALAEPIQLRAEAGVDLFWEGQLLEEALARSERRLAESAEALAGARTELSALTGRCVTAASIVPLPGRPEGWAGENPDVRHLRGMAETRDALARVESSRNELQLQLLGITGPTRSRAFADGPVANEYLVGLSLNWTPDLAGIRRQQAAAERARARSLRAAAESRRRAVEREESRAAVVLERAATRQALLDRELEQTQRALEIAIARWEAGVGRWTEVIRAQEQVEETQSLRIELAREIAFAAIRYGEARGNLAELPRRLGQEAIP